jgi:hypothetical protein
MVLILLFLVFMEIKHKYYYTNINKNEYQDSGFTINKNITRFMGIVGGTASLGKNLINKNKKDIIELSNNLNKQSEEFKKEIFNLEESQAHNKVSVIANVHSMNEQIVEMKKQLDKIKEIFNKKNDTDLITTDEITLNSDLKNYISQIEVNWKKALNYSEEILKIIDIDKNNKILPDNINISKIYENLTNDQLGGIGLILFSQVIIASAISIVFIFFGEYLIQRYDLENKYPKLAKIIQLRRKFQKYYLILNILYICSIGLILGIFGLCLFFN